MFDWILGISDMALREQYKPVDMQNAITLYPERANLFALGVQPTPTKLYLIHRSTGNEAREEYRLSASEGTEVVEADVHRIRWALQKSILDSIARAGYQVKRVRYQPFVTDAGSSVAAHPALRIRSSFETRVTEFSDRYYLCFDHRLRVHANLSLRTLTQKLADFEPLPDQRAMVRDSTGWHEGRISELSSTCEVALASGDSAVLSLDNVFLYLTRPQIVKLAPALGVKSDDLERTIKRLSFLTIENASLARLNACTDFAQRIAKDVFPIVDGEFTITLDSDPAVLAPPTFVLRNDLEEPTICFDRVDSTKRAKDVMTGLTTFGAYETPSEPVRLLVVTTEDLLPGINRLIDRLNAGSVRYRGAERTFNGSFVVEERLISKRVADYERVVRDFAQDSRLQDSDVALVYLPKGQDPRNPSHPYYKIKGILLREGLASQMVDEPTILRPEWRDLNLALNIYAKAGYVPWVLDEAMPGVDLFIGLSSSTVGEGKNNERIMAYVNVFDSYGRWRFYRGDTTAFPFPQRLVHYERLARDAVAAYRAESTGSVPLKAIHFHITKPLRRDERSVLSSAVREVEPDALVTFVWVDPHYILRLFDLSEDARGEIGRATYLLQEPSTVFLSTTGRNMFGHQGMGTPVPLRLGIWTEPYEARPPLEQISQQALSLTRLNWGSTRNFCHEPITTKFAGDIAKRMAVFALDPHFAIHNRLRRVPWFL